MVTVNMDKHKRDAVAVKWTMIFYSVIIVCATVVTVAVLLFGGCG